MTDERASDPPQRRFNPLTGSWVLVSPHRLARPWQGRNEAEPTQTQPGYDPECPLCPGNARADGTVNPDYASTFVFDNDFAALLPESGALASTPASPADELIRSEPAHGVARVMCFSPAHDRSLPELPLDAVRRVVDEWQQQVADLSREFAWVQVFENKGEMMGCSQPHPHGQIWASDFVPTEVEIRDKHLDDYHQRHRSNLLLDYVQRELELRERVVIESGHWVALVPYWAAWPFETMLLPKTHVPRFDALDDAGRQDLAHVLRELLIRYDNLFRCPFPYSMGWHYAPFNGPTAHWQLYAMFLPPLLRSASVRKFMVGYEMLAESQRDLTPELAAQRLREVPARHYRHG